MGCYQKGQQEVLDRIKLHIKDTLRDQGILQPWCPIPPYDCQTTFPLYKLPALSHFLKERSFLRGRLINTDPQAMIRRQETLSPASSLHILLSKGRRWLGSSSSIESIVPTVSKIVQRDSEKITTDGCIRNPSGSLCQAGSRALSSGSPQNKRVS